MSKVHSIGMGTMQVDWEERLDLRRMREERVSKARQALAESGADALFLFRLENVRYLTGLRTHMWPMNSWVTASAILTKHGPTLVAQDVDHVRARMPWIRDNTVAFPAGGNETVHGARNWARLAKGRLAELGVKPDRVGVDCWSPALFEVLPRQFPGTEFIDGEAVMIRARMVKTEDEIDCLRMAYVITAAGMDAARRALRPGIRECEVLGEALQAMASLGGEWTQSAQIVCSGPYTAPYRRFTSDRIIELGDLVIMDLGSLWNGYYGDFTRTWVCGDVEPTNEQVRLHMQAYQALRAAEAAVRPGATTFDVSRAAGPNILGGRLGHGLGVSAAEKPFLGSPELVPLEEAVVLEPGMVFSIEPYAGCPGIGGVRLEDNVLVTQDGHEVISKYPFEERLMA